MATDRNQQIRRQVTLEEVWAFIRTRIERQQAARRKYTLTFEVSVESDGRIGSVSMPAITAKKNH